MTTMKNEVLRPLLASFVVLLSGAVQAETSIDGKIVLANMDRYPAHIRVGTKRREIKPQKASVLTPRRYPAMVEYWSGNTTTGWHISSGPSVNPQGTWEPSMDTNCPSSGGFQWT